MTTVFCQFFFIMIHDSIVYLADYDKGWIVVDIRTFRKAKSLFVSAILPNLLCIPSLSLPNQGNQPSDLLWMASSQTCRCSNHSSTSFCGCSCGWWSSLHCFAAFQRRAGGILLRDRCGGHRLLHRWQLCQGCQCTRGTCDTRKSWGGLGINWTSQCGEIVHGESSHGWKGGECEGHTRSHQDPSNSQVERLHLLMW